MGWRDAWRLSRTPLAEVSFQAIYAFRQGNLPPPGPARLLAPRARRRVTQSKALVGFVLGLITVGAAVLLRVGTTGSPTLASYALPPAAFDAGVLTGLLSIDVALLWWTGLQMLPTFLSSGALPGPRVPADRRDDTAQDRGDRLPQDVRRPGRGRPGGDPAVRRCRPGPAGRPRRGAGRRHCHSVRARTIVRYRPLLRAQDPGFPWWGGPDGGTLGPPAPLADPRGRRARVRLRRSGVLHRPGRCRLRELPGNLRSVRGRVPVHARDAAGPRRGRSPRCFAELLGAPRVGHCIGRLRAPGGVRLAVAVRVGPVGVPPSHYIVSARAATPVPSCGRSIPRSRS